MSDTHIHTHDKHYYGGLGGDLLAKSGTQYSSTFNEHQKAGKVDGGKTRKGGGERNQCLLSTESENPNIKIRRIIHIIKHREKHRTRECKYFEVHDRPPYVVEEGALMCNESNLT